MKKVSHYYRLTPVLGYTKRIEREAPICLDIEYQYRDMLPYFGDDKRYYVV